METRVYSIHHQAPEDFEAIPDGFSLLALLLPWVWAVWHRCWVTLVGMVMLLTLVAAFSPLAATPVMYAIAVILAFEGGWVRRLERRTQGWRQVALVEAASPEGAEEKYLTGQAL